MKIKETAMSIREVLNLPKQVHVQPRKQGMLARTLLYLASIPEMRAIRFQCQEQNMEKISGKQPCLFLMNHSSFTDLQIAATILRHRSYHIVCTKDGFVGKETFMRWIGCIPAKKFITDLQLVKDMKYAVDTLNSSILMFPEASYSFDGTETPLPESIGKFVRMLKVPVVMIRTQGAFLRDPLYNGLQKRKASVSAKLTCILDEEDVKTKSVEEINTILADAFRYDHFREQKEQGIKITEKFRADGLHRVLYKCPCCQEEGKMHGEGIHIFCRSCGNRYELKEDGTLFCENGETRFSFVSDWYRWERDCVAEEIEAGTYTMDLEVEIRMLADMKAIYHVGEGTLHHDSNGFVLKGCDGELNYVQHPNASYSLYSDYFWYEIGDMVSIGDTKYQYYCFPKDQENAIVAKSRLAAEEIYKRRRQK